MPSFKMKTEHYEELEQAIKKVQRENVDVTLASYISKGLSSKRYRWDLLYAAIAKGYYGEGRGWTYISDVLYQYLNDDHIDSALRKITRTR